MTINVIKAMIYLGDTMSFVISKIKEFINSMIAILVSILLLVFMIVSIPFDYIKYKFSLFYKNEKIPQKVLGSCS